MRLKLEDPYGFSAHVPVELVNRQFFEMLGVKVEEQARQFAPLNRKIIFNPSLLKYYVGDAGKMPRSLYLAGSELIYGGSSSNFHGMANFDGMVAWITINSVPLQALGLERDDAIFHVGIDVSRLTTQEIRSGLEVISSANSELFDQAKIRLLGSLAMKPQEFDRAKSVSQLFNIAAVLFALLSIASITLYARASWEAYQSTEKALFCLGIIGAKASIPIFFEIAAIVIVGVAIGLPVSAASDNLVTLLGNFKGSTGRGELIPLATVIAIAVFGSGLALLSKPLTSRTISQSISYRPLRVRLVTVQLTLFIVSTSIAISFAIHFNKLTPQNKAYSFSGSRVHLIDFGFDKPFPPKDAGWHNHLRDTLRELNETGVAAMANSLAPLTGQRLEDAIIYRDGNQHRIKINRVTRNYFDVIGLRVDGEIPDYQPEQGAFESPDKVIVNLLAAKLLDIGVPRYANDQINQNREIPRLCRGDSRSLTF